MIETERLILRHWQDEDLENFSALNANPIVMEYMPKLLDRAESDAMATRIRNNLKTNDYGLWAVQIKNGEPFIGFIGLSKPNFESHFTPAIEIGWRLASKHWGQGYATEGAHAVRDFAFNSLKLDELVSFTTTANIPSRRVMEKIGMSYNPDDDFGHPNLDTNHPQHPHVLYRLQKP